MNSSDFLDGAPKFLTNRFNSVNKFVWETMFPEEKRNEIIKKKKSKIERKAEFIRLRSISDEAAIIVFLFLIYRFFIDGSKAAKNAVDTLKELDIQGFYIGSNFFAERNEKVIQGDKLSDILILALQDENVKRLVTKSTHVSEIIDEYKKFI